MPYDPDTLRRFLEGKATPEEAAEVRRWAAEATEAKWDSRDMWNSIAREIRDDVAAPQAARTSPRGIRRIEQHKARWQHGMRVAGLAAVLVVGVGIGAMVLSDNWRDGESDAPPPPRTVVTKRGEHATLDLADGSHVVLAPDSRLVIPGRFNERGLASSREVELTGQGYFVVTHDTLRPFRVVSGTTVTEDIGTSFVVNAYPEVGGTRVVVEEGVVQLRRTVGSVRPTVVNAGSLARVDSAGAVTVIHDVRVADYVAWTRGTIAFDATPLAEAIPQLERWYDLTIRVRDTALLSRRLTGSFESASSERMLQQLSMTLGVRVTRASADNGEREVTLGGIVR